MLLLCVTVNSYRQLTLSHIHRVEFVRFQEAAKLGIARTVHAGENGTAANVAEVG